MSEDNRIDEIYEVVAFIKDNMATKFELAEVKSDVAEVKDRVFAIEGKLDGINRRVDDVVDKNKQFDVRTTKLETKVFGT